MTALLAVDSVTIAYGNLVAVREASLTVDDGELVVILGANGAGKSTLLAACIGWLRPQRGSIRLRGEEIDHLEPWQRFRRGLAFVPEGGRVFAELTVEENLRAAQPTENGLKLVLELFPVLGERSRQLAGTLSGGERQMLALARAIATEPQLLMVDEASLGLMPTLVRRVFDVLVEMRSQGLPILLVEQNTQALRIADRAYVLETGRIVQHGPAAELLDDPAVQRAYLGA